MWLREKKNWFKNCKSCALTTSANKQLHVLLFPSPTEVKGSWSR